IGRCHDAVTVNVVAPRIAPSCAEIVVVPTPKRPRPQTPRVPAAEVIALSQKSSNGPSRDRTCDPLIPLGPAEIDRGPLTERRRAGSHESDPPFVRPSIFFRRRRSYACSCKHLHERAAAGGV